MIEWGQVTWYSKLGAIILFVGIVPVLTFYIGMQYQQVTMPIQNVSISTSQKILTPHLNILAGRLSETEGHLVPFRWIKNDTRVLDDPELVKYPGQILTVYPYSNASSTTRPQITFYTPNGIPFEQAAVYFPNVIRDHFALLGENPPPNLKSNTAPRGLSVVPILPNLVKYSLPNENGLIVRGMAYYEFGEGNQPDFFTDVRIKIDPSDENLASFVLEDYIFYAASFYDKTYRQLLTLQNQNKI